MSHEEEKAEPQVINAADQPHVINPTDQPHTMDVPSESRTQDLEVNLEVSAPSSRPHRQTKTKPLLPQFAAKGITDRSMRRAFVRKVYLVVATQLLMTISIVCFFTFVKEVKLFVQKYPIVYYLACVIYTITLILMAVSSKYRRHFPHNFIALSIFTLALSYLVATIASYYDTLIVLIAIAITCGVSLAITLFVTCTKYDFTFCIGLAFILSNVISFFAIALLVVWLVAGKAYILETVYGGLSALLFGLYLAFDTQMVIGGSIIQLSEEEYISGALELYIDIIYLFLLILVFFGDCIASFLK